MAKESVVIIDYGSGNLRSAAKAFEHVRDAEGLTVDVKVSARPEDLKKATRIVLPGQGAFGDCLKGLSDIKGMREALQENVIKKGKPFLGICVGMQLMAPLVAGGLGDTGNPADFRWGFLSAAVGMAAATLIFQVYKDRYVVDAQGRPLGLPSSQRTRAHADGAHDAPLNREDWERVAVIFILSFFVIFFWMAFEQAGASLTVFADRQTDRGLLGWTVPASWFQSINAVAIVLYEALRQTGALAARTSKTRAVAASAGKPPTPSSPRSSTAPRTSASSSPTPTKQPPTATAILG